MTTKTLIFMAFSWFRHNAQADLDNTRKRRSHQGLQRHYARKPLVGKGFRPIACPDLAAALRFVRDLAAIHRDDRVLYAAVCRRHLIDAASKCKPAAPLEREPPAVLLPRCRSKKKRSEERV